MENLSFDFLLSQGVFCILFVYLLIDTKKDSKVRESKYQKIIDKNQSVISDLANKLDSVEDIKEDVKEIKIKLNGAV